ncbi:MAG: GtrA family protein [Alphaproteobacteria bacterium]|nr:GtrA family protein [Alphaproteobacteria bacterium]
MSIVKAYKYIEDIWFKQNEKLRFLLVGGFNTATSFIIYYIFLYLTSGREQLSLFLMNLININISITTMRYYVFRSTGNFLKEYSKAFSSYIVLYFVNMGLLAFFVRVVHIAERLPQNSFLLDIPNLNKAVAQICCICIITIMTFFVHKYFSFRKVLK